MLALKFNKAGWVSMLGLGLALGCGAVSGLQASDAAAPVPGPVVMNDEDWIFDEQDNVFFFRAILDKKTPRIIEWRNERWLVEEQTIQVVRVAPAAPADPQKRKAISDKQLMDEVFRQIQAQREAEAAAEAVAQLAETEVLVQEATAVTVVEAVPVFNFDFNFFGGGWSGGDCHHHHDCPPPKCPPKSNPPYCPTGPGVVTNPQPAPQPPQVIKPDWGQTIVQQPIQTLPTTGNPGTSGNNGNSTTTPGGSNGTPGNGSTNPGTNQPGTNPGGNNNGGNANNGRGSLVDDINKGWQDTKDLTQRNAGRANDVLVSSNDTTNRNLNDVRDVVNEGVNRGQEWVGDAVKDPVSAPRKGVDSANDFSNNTAEHAGNIGKRGSDNTQNGLGSVKDAVNDTVNTGANNAGTVVTDVKNATQDAVHQGGDAANNAWNNSGLPHIGSNPNNVPPPGWNNQAGNSTKTPYAPVVSRPVKNTGMEIDPKKLNTKPVNTVNTNTNAINKGNTAQKTYTPTTPQKTYTKPTTQTSTQNTLNNDALRNRKSR